MKLFAKATLLRGRTKNFVEPARRDLYLPTVSDLPYLGEVAPHSHKSQVRPVHKETQMKYTCFRASLLGALALLASVGLKAQNVITDWNAIASTTIVAKGGKASSTASVWFAYTSIAVYDAVNAIHQQFQPFYFHGRVLEGASEEAAAVAAAHRVLVTYFPSQQAALDAQFTNSLGNIVAAPHAKTAGIAVGEAAAATLIAARNGDGLEANVLYTPGSGPGVWQPTPPKFGSALTPWLGQMRPFTLTSASEFLPAGPTPLTSEEWVDDYNQIRVLGDVNSTVRTPEQSEIGLFWTEHTAQQYARAFNYLSQNYGLNVMDSARLMAIVWTGFADAAIGCWNAKFTYNFWRPVTAIRAGGGNPDLIADPDWTPLGTTPAHPEYPAAHGCVTGAVSSLTRDYFGTRKVHVVVDSLAFSDGIHTHVFDDTRDWFGEVFRARIYAGFHYQHSLEDGGALGRRVAKQLFRRHFRPLAERDRDNDGDDEH